MTDWALLLNVCQWGMGYEMPKRVSSTGGKFALNDNSETPDTQAALYEFKDYMLIFEHQMVGGLGPGGQPHGMLFCGTEGTVIIREGGWEFIPEPKKKDLEPIKKEDTADARPAHVRTSPDCMHTAKLHHEFRGGTLRSDRCASTSCAPARKYTGTPKPNGQPTIRKRMPGGLSLSRARHCRIAAETPELLTR